jgi:anti-sigma regulatory factor (Ser/Thr protein kinase)
VISQRRFPNLPAAVTQARRYVFDLLGDIDPDIADDAAVMVSELATNSLRHASSQFVVRVERAGDEITISVEDSGPGAPVLQSPTPRESRGRGLQIVAALASRWGVTRSSDGPGKKVWFTIATRPSGAKIRDERGRDATVRRAARSDTSRPTSNGGPPRLQAAARAAA